MTPDRPTGPATATGQAMLRGMHDGPERDAWILDVTAIESEIKARILAALPEALRQTMKDDSFDEWRLRFDGSHDELAAALAAAIEKVLTQ